MTTLEKIRAEIAEIAPLDYPCDKRTPEHIRDMALDIIDKYAEQEPCDDNRLYIKVYADLEPQEKAEKLYQICEEDELKEVYKELGEYCKIEPCEDVVSRQAGLNAISRIGLCKCSTNEVQAVDECLRAIEELSPVRPQEPKTGHWINGNPICPCCGEDKFKDLDADVWADWKPKYCPNCGCAMKGELE